uniref:Secreted RxLR effector protein 29 n=1 Tax=Plasmopara viticola TaxID=143451 RepID=RLR29_PLAVT|nr:RecName: Full=Secreted RxLR effector protein 29; Flags: Precursor [Plasmopara viticola]ANC73379.1 secreted RxLR effector peptide protein 29 [Plasmopara viticola]
MRRTAFIVLSLVALIAPCVTSVAVEDLAQANNIETNVNPNVKVGSRRHLRSEANGRLAVVDEEKVFRDFCGLGPCFDWLKPQNLGGFIYKFVEWASRDRVNFKLKMLKREHQIPIRKRNQ